MDGTGEQRALRKRRFRPLDVLGSFSGGKARVIFPQKRKKLLCPLVNAQRGKVSFLGGRLDGAYDLVCQRNLRFDAAAIVLYVIKALLHHLGQILRQHLGRLCRVDGRSGFAGFRNFRKLTLQSVVDDLFVQSGMQHDDTSLQFSSIIARIGRLFNALKCWRQYKIKFSLSSLRFSLRNLSFG